MGITANREAELVRLALALAGRVCEQSELLSARAEKIPNAGLPLWKRLYKAIGNGSRSTPSLVRQLGATRARVWKELRMMESKKLVVRREGSVRGLRVAVWSRIAS